MKPAHRYAARTEVPIEKSRIEIERTIKRFGAKNFVVGSVNGMTHVMFEANGRRVRFSVPDITDPPYSARLSYESRCEREMQRLWRSLAMTVKAKLDIIESGISTFEAEMLAYTMLADGRTVAEATETNPRFLEEIAGSVARPMLNA
jgi:uncharacterized UPF0146 family protein